MASEMSGPKGDLEHLERSGWIKRIPSRDPDGDPGYVLTPAGRDMCEGD